MSEKSFILLLWIILLNPTFASISIKSKLTETCMTYSKEFWNVYRQHFSLSKSVTITGLYAREHYYIMREFTDEIIRNMYAYGNIHMTVSLKKLFLGRYRKNLERPSYQKENNPWHPHTHREVTSRELRRMIRQAADVFQGNIIIVWDEESLQRFLDTNHRKVIVNPRALYVIFLVYTTKSEYCLNWQKEITAVLKRLWRQLNVLNVLVQAPCSCDPENIFIYHPFYRGGGARDIWGIVDVHSLKEIQTNPEFIVNALEDLNGYPINISMFERNPTSMQVLPKHLSNNIIYQDYSKSAGFGGVDGCILYNLALYMNFTVKIVRPKGTNFGSVLGNGSVTGSLGDVVNGLAQFSGNSRFLTDYKTDRIEFTKPFNSDQICVVAPKSKRIPQWMVIFRCFKLFSWMVILAILLFCMFFWRLLQSTPSSFLQIYAIFLGTSIKLTPRGLHHHIFLSACLIFNVIIIGIFQGTLVTSFSTISYFKDINTLEELDASGLGIATSLHVFDADQTKLMQRLHKKTRYVAGASLSLAAYERNVGGLERKQDAALFIKIHYMRDDGVPLLHIVEECPVSYFVAYIVPKGSPFLFKYNSIIVKVIENGLTFKWYKDITDSLVIDRMYHIKDFVQAQKVFTMHDMQTAFIVLTLGLLLAGMVFGIEILCKIRENKKK